MTYKPYFMKDVVDNSNKELFNVISTFAGGGGSSTGYRLAGGKILCVNEFVEAAVDTYKSNYPNTPVLPDDIKKLSFEKALEQLEEIVDNLESGNVDLEKSIENYTRGSLLRSHCQAKLDEAVLKLEEIKVSSDGKISKK